MAASPQCRALISSAIEGDMERERLEQERFYAELPNLWDPVTAAEVLEAEKPKEVISRADKTAVGEFPPGSEGMLGRVYTEVTFTPLLISAWTLWQCQGCWIPA